MHALQPKQEKLDFKHRQKRGAARSGKDSAPLPKDAKDWNSPNDEGNAQNGRFPTALVQTVCHPTVQATSNSKVVCLNHT